MKKNEIDDMINQAKSLVRPSGARCKTCKTPEAIEILDRYFERLDSGEEELPTLRWIHQATMMNKVSFGSVRNHTIKCLNRDPVTGEKNG